jgi:hypothetical protein
MKRSGAPATQRVTKRLGEPSLLYRLARSGPSRRMRILGRVVVATVLCAAPAAFPETALRISLPSSYDTVDAITYDAAGRERVGRGFIEYQKLDGGLIRFRGSSGIKNAERTIVTAVLEPAPDGAGLRPIRQESRSFDSGGRPLGVLTIDHRAGVGTCHLSDKPKRSVKLPNEDRVANVVLAQVLKPLALAGKGEFPFQILICRPGVRVLRAKARVIQKEAWTGGTLVEIEMGAELGPILGRLLAPWLPKVSVWFDAGQAKWMGQRVPLFAKGPTVTVLRADVASEIAPVIQR